MQKIIDWTNTAFTLGDLAFTVMFHRKIQKKNDL